MYQSVGSEIIETIGIECLQLPLYRIPISGRAIIQTLEYNTISEINKGFEEDEVESLFYLLLYIKVY